MNSGKLTHLDLFSGIGGFTLGFEAAGFRTLAFAETDPHARLVLAHHWPDVPNLGDVTKLCRRAYDCEPENEDGEVWCPRCDESFGECACIGTDQFTDEHGFPDVITGGVPCQPASALGQMRGAGDERWLWPEALRVVRELRPRFAVFENPPSVLVLPDFHGVLGTIAALGYDLWWDVIPAAALGAGHLRERVFFVLADTTRVPKRKPPDQADAIPTSRPARPVPPRAHSFGPAADPGGARLEGYSRHGDGSGQGRGCGPPPRRPVAPPHLCDRVTGPDWWHEAHTGIPVLAHGLSAGLVKAACRCAGNAVVPQVAQVIAEAIRQAA